MTRTREDLEHTYLTRQRGLLGFSGHPSHSPGELGLCVSSRAPSRAGRSPYHSEPSIEAPDSTTTSRRIPSETPAITHHPHHQVIPGSAPRPASQAVAYRPRRLSPGLPERSEDRVSASVQAGVVACGHGHLPKSPGEIRSYSGLGHAFRPLSRGFPAAGGCWAARHLNRIWPLGRHLRFRSVKTCSYGALRRSLAWS